jgi:putative acetyltransferase
MDARTAIPRIRLDDLSDPRIAAFMEEHLQDMRATSPPESVHALDLEKLRQPDIRFWSVWLPDGHGETLACTGAIKRLDDRHAELKSMRTGTRFRGQGLARLLLDHIVGQAGSMGYHRLSLETGTQPFFAPAHQLYLSYGFEDSPPFGSYTRDPNSRFLTLLL